MNDASLTIVGSGLAAYNLARAWRRLGATAPLRIISRDDASFYAKPNLSNGLASAKTAAQLATRTAAQMADELQAEVINHTDVVAIDRPAQQLRTRRGDFAYHNLVLASGADPVALPIVGAQPGLPMQVNDLADYARFRERLEGAQSVLVLGAGLVGCEFANDLASTGRSVEVIDTAGWPLARLLPQSVGQRFQAGLAAAGVRFSFGVSVHTVRGEGGQCVAGLSDGSERKVDLVLSAVGLRPRIALAQAAGLAVNRGVVVDRHLQTIDPHIYALGDVAEVGGQCLPYVLPIMQASKALAATLMGTPTSVVYPAMPVVVKTPACPLVVCPPPMGRAGAWQEEPSEDGWVARCVADDGQLLGFALLGAATRQRQTLAAQCPAWLGG